MRQVLLTGGGAVVDEVPVPSVGRRNILVRVAYSCISVGTEGAGMAAAAVPLYKRALRQPENVRLAMKMVQEQGVGKTWRRIQGMLQAGQPTGYSAAGVVVAVGEEVTGFSVGDRVACAGAGIANHAEFIDVPVNLAVAVPPVVALEHACTVTLGAIALQGVRRTAPTLGETVVVIGLGILGQLTVQLLRANGCRVIGLDPEASRLTLARQQTGVLGLDPQSDPIVSQVAWHTDGLGADAVIVTAAAPDHDIVRLAMQACRKKGRVVLVGDVGLNLRREDFYKKELDFLISSSYGPGRYDPYYEEGGQDYPLPYVRWTENRNMAAYLALLADGQIDLSVLQPEVHDITEADVAYRRIAEAKPKPLLALLRYPDGADAQARSVRLPRAGGSPRLGGIRTALIGAGAFAQGMHLPNLVRLRDRFELRWIISRQGAQAKAVARQYEVPAAGTDFGEVLRDPEVDLVIITTRHHLHAGMTLAALQAGKHVFVEKPLALRAAELDAIEAFYGADPAGKPLLMTGYNRRFSPPIRQVRDWLSQRSGPMILQYRMNAGYLPPEHWVHGEEGGGRNLGEACHIYDLFVHLTGSRPVTVQAQSLHRRAAQVRGDDNFSVTASFADGSMAHLLYTSLGPQEVGKERLEIFVDGKLIELDDYKSVTLRGARAKPWHSTLAQKGQFEELQALAQALRDGGPWPISLTEQLDVARLALSVETQIHQRLSEAS